MHVKHKKYVKTVTNNAGWPQHMNKVLNNYLLTPYNAQASTRDKIIRGLEIAQLASLMTLAAGLPYADITASRDIAVILGLLSWIAHSVLKKEFRWKKTPLDLPIALLLAVGLASVFTAVDTKYSLSEIRGEMLKSIILFYMAVNLVRTENRARAVFYSLIAGVILMDVYGILHFTINGGSWDDYRILREKSLHRGPMELATYLVQTLPYLLVGLIWYRKSSRRFILVFFILIHIALVYTSFSRIACLVVGFEIACFFWIAGLRWPWFVIAFVIVFVAVGFIMPRSIFLTEGRTSIEGEEAVRIGGIGILGLKGTRLDLWKKGIRRIKEHPFEGLGLGRESFKKKYPEINTGNPMLWHGHNIFLNMALQMGIQGLAVFLFILYRIFRHTWPGLKFARYKIEDISHLTVGAAWLMTAGFIARNMTDDLYNNDAAYLFWLLAGLAFSVKLFILDASKDNETIEKTES